LLQGAVAQLTFLSRTSAIAILEAALKQMHVCALLHNNVNNLSLTSTVMRITSHSPACLFCWPHQPELHAACLLLACWWLVVRGAWCRLMAGASGT
jgi:hypothetical protein